MVSLEEKALATYEAELCFAYTDGEAKGKTEMILGMLSRGRSPQSNADLTGIPLSQMEQVITN